MARRRRRRKGRSDLVVVGAVLVGLAVLNWLVGFAAAHKVELSVAAAVMVAVGVAAGLLVLRRRRLREARQAELDRNIAGTDAMSGAQFEQYVARLMRRSGFRRVEVCGGSGDLGADVVGYTSDGRRAVVQCKRYAGSVGDPHIQKFNGTVREIHGADVALFVTTGRPTVQARRLAERFAIVLVDRTALAVWATDGVPPIAGWPGRSTVAILPPPPEGTADA